MGMITKTLNRLLNGITITSQSLPTTTYKTFAQLQLEFLTAFPYEHEHATLSLYVRILVEDLFAVEASSSTPSPTPTPTSIPTTATTATTATTNYSALLLKRIVLYFYLYALSSWYMLKELLYSANYGAGMTSDERLFILKLLLFSDKNQELSLMLNETPLSILIQKDVNQQLENISRNPVLINALNEMKRSYIYDMQLNSLRGMRSRGISRSIYLKDAIVPIIDPATIASSSSEIIFVQQEDADTDHIALYGEEDDDTDFLLRFEPRFQRPAPDMLPIADHETFWLLPSDSRSMEKNLSHKDLVLCESIGSVMPTLSRFSLDVTQKSSDPLHLGSDSDLGFRLDATHSRRNSATSTGGHSTEEEDSEHNEESKWRKLFSSAFSQQLKPVQQSFVSQHMDQCLSQTSILTPNRLSDLVRNNPEIAVRALKHYIANGNPGVDEYLSVLANMQPVCLQSMEVINSLLEANIPSIDMEAYLTVYIHNGISSCDRMTSDSSMQKRLVRILVVFLKSLVQRQVLDVTSDKYQDLIVQLKSFCIQFSKMREATELFRLLEMSKS